MAKITRGLSIFLGIVGLLITVYLAFNYMVDHAAMHYSGLPLYVNIIWGIWTAATFIFTVSLLFKRLYGLGWIVGVFSLVLMGTLYGWIGPFDLAMAGYISFIIVGLVNSVCRRKLSDRK